MSDFDQFWAAYPNRKAKLDAMKAYAAARQTASADDILAGVHRYVKGKPEYCDWKLPAGWLRAGRWMDEYETALPTRVQEDCPHTPECHNRSWCRTVSARQKGEVA